MAPDARMTVGRRFNGPAPSGNGGYTCGLLAAAAGLPAPVTVRLLRPPPLEEPLEVVPAGGEGAVELRGEGGPVATAVAAGTATWTDIEPVGFEEAAAAEREYAGHRSHPFPRCFVCGTDREPGDGLRLFPGRVGEGLVAASWTPDTSLAGPGERLPAPVTWAALDCPSAWTTDLESRPLVLGEMTAEVEVPPVAGTPYVVVARHRGTEGRKVRTASALFDTDGRRLARAEHVWLAIGPELLAELQRG